MEYTSSIEYDNDLIKNFEDINERLEYNDKYKNKNYKNIHYGQLKLLLNEFRFLNGIDIVEYSKNKEEINLLYIGSGKGFHIPILINSLKANINNNINWFFYDPNGHCKTLENWNNGININIRNKLFTENDIIHFKNKNNIIFISDIRTSSGKEPTISNLLYDYQLQNYILEELKPDYSNLKCRYPFPDNEWFTSYGTDFKFKFPIGVEYIQSFTPLYSSELRLLLRKEFIYKDVDTEVIQEYEEKMFWYNTEFRV